MTTLPADSADRPGSNDDLALDHIYRETLHWDPSVAWWRKLGFEFESTWGEAPHRAGSLRRGAVVVVLAEVSSDTQPAATTFLSTSDLIDVAERSGQPVVDTHWGTRMVTLEDPDGRIYNFEPQEGA